MKVAVDNRASPGFFFSLTLLRGHRGVGPAREEQPDDFDGAIARREMERLRRVGGRRRVVGLGQRT